MVYSLILHAYMAYIHLSKTMLLGWIDNYILLSIPNATNKHPQAIKMQLNYDCQ